MIKEGCFYRQERLS